MRIFIGYDGRERAAYKVAEKSALDFHCDVEPLYENRLRLSGMLVRPTDRRGEIWDLNSDAPASTEFAIARFFVPLLAHSGWALFVDCDVVFLSHPKELIKYMDPAFAVLVVKHPPMQLGTTKMEGQTQTAYHRKLWSSVMLFNVDHPANARINLQMLNQWPGRDLHALKWLNDSEIGELPPEWNWLVGLQDKPEHPRIAHYTLGTPNMKGHENDEHAELWLSRASAR